MASLRERVLAERENVELALAGLREALGRSQKTSVELAAAATFVHNVYNGIENILRQMLAARSIDVPRADTWHQELLKRSAAAGIISGDLASDLKDYLGFRHFFVHGYGFMLRESPLQDLAKRLPTVWSRFVSEVEHELDG